MITRYDVRISAHGGVRIVISDQGRYVIYDDHMDEVKDYRNTIDNKQLEVNDLKNDIKDYQYIINKVMKGKK